MKFIGTLVLAGILFLPTTGLAQEEGQTNLERAGTGGADQTTVQTVEDVEAVVTRIVGWAQVFFYIIATLFIILAAFRYLTSGGDDEKVNAAKNMLIYSIVAIAIASVAGGVVLLVKNFIEVGDPQVVGYKT